MGESKNIVKSDGWDKFFRLRMSQNRILVLVGMVVLCQWGCTPEYRPVQIILDPGYGSGGQ